MDHFFEHRTPAPHEYHNNDDDHLELAHFNKPELDALDHIQGKSERVNGVRVYSRLGTALNHPDMIHHIHRAHMEHLAHVKELARNGRFGDTEIAWVPKHVLRTFDHSIGGPVRNPRDGKKEYFLGALLSTISRFAKPAISAIGKMFSKPAAQAVSTNASKLNAMFPKPGIGAASGYAPSSKAVTSLSSQLPRMGASV
jgi:hypothetical protein